MDSSTQEPQNPSPAPAMLSPEAVVQQLRALRVQIPLPDALPAMPASRRRRLGHVDSQFVVAAINGTGASPAVQAALGRSDEDLRQEQDVCDRWTAVIDEVRALMDSLVDANTLRRQRIGLAALQTYDALQTLPATCDRCSTSAGRVRSTRSSPSRWSRCGAHESEYGFPPPPRE